MVRAPRSVHGVWVNGAQIHEGKAMSNSNAAPGLCLTGLIANQIKLRVTQYDVSQGSPNFMPRRISGVAPNVFTTQTDRGNKQAGQGDEDGMDRTRRPGGVVDVRARPGQGFPEPPSSRDLSLRRWQQLGRERAIFR